ncbi:hypothetical protein OQA88_7191 [Cercophora sp. LCS_1]
MPRLIRQYDYKHEPDRRNRFSDMCPKEDDKVRAILASSFDADHPPSASSSPIISSANGFVLGALKAYNKHHHFVIRPDDIWLAILTQLSFYINRQADALRPVFRPNTAAAAKIDAKPRITAISLSPLLATNTKRDPNPNSSSHIEQMALALASTLSANLSPPGIANWITPTFTTSTTTDAAAAAIIMAGAFRSYFNYAFVFYCGMPSVTLQGSRGDWVSILERSERIPEFFGGGEATAEEVRHFQALLGPVLKGMVRTFDEPDAEDVLDFWAKMVHESGGSGTHYISGWLTAFCFWDADGVSLYGKMTDKGGGVEVDTENGGKPGCRLGDVVYHRVESGGIPVGWAGAPVDVVDERGDVWKVMLVAGSMGLRVSSSGERLDRNWEDQSCLKVSTDADGTRKTERGEVHNVSGRRRDAEMEAEVGMDTLQPVIGWWMYETATEGDDGDDYWKAETEEMWEPAGLAARMKTGDLLSN